MNTQREYTKRKRREISGVTYWGVCVKGYQSEERKKKVKVQTLVGRNKLRRAIIGYVMKLHSTRRCRIHKASCILLDTLCKIVYIDIFSNQVVSDILKENNGIHLYHSSEIYAYFLFINDTQVADGWQWRKIIVSMYADQVNW